MQERAIDVRNEKQRRGPSSALPRYHAEQASSGPHLHQLSLVANKHRRKGSGHDSFPGSPQKGRQRGAVSVANKNSSYTASGKGTVIVAGGITQTSGRLYPSLKSLSTIYKSEEGFGQPSIEVRQIYASIESRVNVCLHWKHSGGPIGGSRTPVGPV